MATIYDHESGNELTSGLKGCNTCDEAIQAAERHADTLGRAVELVDDDGRWLVHPMVDGVREPADSLDDATSTADAGATDRLTINTARDLIHWLRDACALSVEDAERVELPLRRRAYAAGLAMGDDWGAFLDGLDLADVQALVDA